ncbi:MAG: sulfide/dihydroorotate dehydrogenase-like FAD/NAD-binding protein [Candidatus Aegiribacteria sp.]
MYQILHKEKLGPDIWLYKIKAPDVAEYREPGQFVIVRISDDGERIPITIAEVDRNEGSITLIVQAVGKTTLQMTTLEVGETIPTVTGPLGRPTTIEKVGRVLCVGGGIGIAPLYPVARAMREAGNHVTSIIGARSSNLLILEDRMRRVSSEIVVTTDDGTSGCRGFVTDSIRNLLEIGESFQQCVAMGPPIMMKCVCDLTREYEIPTIVSLNPIMVDGTGMCGCCRVTVGDSVKFACVDGPEFDGHQVDFSELMTRLKTYGTEEREALDCFSSESGCRLDAMLEGGAR